MLLLALGTRVADLPAGVLEQLCRELCFVLLLVLKRARLAYTPELGLAPLVAPVLLLALSEAAPPGSAGQVTTTPSADYVAL